MLLGASPNSFRALQRAVPEVPRVQASCEPQTPCARRAYSGLPWHFPPPHLSVPGWHRRRLRLHVARCLLPAGQSLSLCNTRSLEDRCHMLGRVPNYPFRCSVLQACVFMISVRKTLTMFPITQGHWSPILNASMLIVSPSVVRPSCATRSARTCSGRICG